MLENPTNTFSSESFHELLTISENHPDAVVHWITKNIDRSQTLDEILGAIGQNPRYFHFYFEYARQVLQKWNILPKKLIPSLEYLFRNFTSLSKENVNITKAIDGYEFEIIFANPVVLSSITSISVNECDPESLIRFIRYYLRNYERNLSLREHKIFFQKSIDYLTYLKPEDLHDIFWYHTEKLFQEIGFSLSRWYAIFFEVTKTEWQQAYASDREIAHIRRISEDVVLSEMEAMDMKTFCGFVDRFRSRVTEGRIHFLGFQNIGQLAEKKRFYLSIAYKTRVFWDEEKSTFLAYCLEEMEKGGGRIYGENLFSDISVLLNFFSLEKISIFANVELFLRITKAVSKNERYIFAFEQYLRSLEGRAFVSADFAIDTFKKTHPFSDKVVTPIFICFAYQLLRYFSFGEYLDFVEREDSKWWIKSRSDGLPDLLISSIQRISQTGYRTQERFLRHLLSTELLPQYTKTNVVKSYAAGSRRMRYVLIRNTSFWSKIVTTHYEMREIHERCFSSTVFPVGIVHAICYLFAKS